MKIYVIFDTKYYKLFYISSYKLNQIVNVCYVHLVYITTVCVLHGLLTFVLDKVFKLECELKLVFWNWK